jgi:flagellar hook-associated protein 1 FlgK
MSVSTFMGLHTALRGILAHQRSLDVTSHNIANAGTEGYSRQEAVLETAGAMPIVGAGWLGTGVDVAEYRRIRDTYLDVQMRAQTMLKSYHETRQNGLEQVEMALAEPSDSGLSTLLNRFWSGWQDLANAPENQGVRQALVQTTGTLAAGFNALHSQLTTVDAQTNAEIANTVDDVNSLLQRLAAVEQPIMDAVGVGQNPSNDLLDERDALVDKLAEIVNLTVTPETDGSVTLRVGTKTLLQAGVPTPIAGVADFVVAGVDQLMSGKLEGLVALTTSIAGPGGYIARLNGIASSLIANVNALQSAGYALGAGAPSGISFFSGADASDIGVNAAIVADPRLIAAADGASQAGNGMNALTVSALRTDPTLDPAYSQLVTSIGADTREARRSTSNATVLTDALENRRQSVSGVSLDEEMTNLLRFQRGFQASARAMNAMDETIEMLINRTGRAGL